MPDPRRENRAESVPLKKIKDGRAVIMAPLPMEMIADYMADCKICRNVPLPSADCYNYRDCYHHC